jgi:hypothetical protein
LKKFALLLVLVLFALVVCGVVAALAGPPYVTDDPEPVEYRHWEVYFASIFTKEQGAWTTTAPHIEVNYGAAPNLQLHTILPMTLYAPSDGATSYGYGDTELGAKYRFVQESDWYPQVGTFPLIEVPTGSHARNLGSGHVQNFLPIWFQKSLGSWTGYGGGGYWINPGTNERNWWFTGLLVQYSVLPNLAPGLEIFHQTRQAIGGPRETRFSLGFVWDLTDVHHIMASAGRGLEGPNQVQGYLAYQLTFGPYP